MTKPKRKRLPAAERLEQIAANDKKRERYAQLVPLVNPLVQTVRFALGKAETSGKVITHALFSPSDYANAHECHVLHAEIYAIKDERGIPVEARMLRILGVPIWADEKVVEGDVSVHYSRFAKEKTDESAIEQVFEFAQPDGSIVRMTPEELKEYLDAHPEIDEELAATLNKTIEQGKTA